MTQRSQRDVLRDWWYSPERHGSITSMRFAKSIEITLALAGYEIVPKRADAANGERARMDEVKR